MATELYRKFRDQFDCRAMVTVSQGSDLEAILTSIKNQVMPQSDDQKQQGSSSEKRSLGAAFQGMFKCRCGISGVADNNNDQAKSESDSGHKEQQDTLEHDSEEEEEQSSLVGKKSLTVAVRDTLGQVRRCTSALMDKCSISSTSKKTQDNARLIQLKEDLRIVLTQNRYATPNLSALCFIAPVHIARYLLLVLNYEPKWMVHCLNKSRGILL